MKLLINGVLLAAIGGLLFLLAQIHEKRVMAQEQLASLQAKVAALSNENTELEGDIEYYSLQKNLEKEARARLNVKRPDEQLIILTPKAGETQSQTTTSAAASRHHWFKSLTSFVKDKLSRD